MINNYKTKESDIIKEINVFSMYDGMSCGRLSLENLGYRLKNYYASEIDKYAIQIAQKNYPDTIQIGDACAIDFSKYKDIDVLLGGSPCTFWSIAKNNREVDKSGEGWMLFSKYLDALKMLKPKYFLYENVASMPSTIKDFITEEFGVEPIKINSALVSAQQRNRLYWTNIPGITQPEDRQIYLKDILESGYTDRLKSYCIDANYFKGGNMKSYLEKSRRQLVFEKPYRLGHFNKGGQGDRIYAVEGKSVTLSANGGGRGAKTGLYYIDLGDGEYTIRKLTPVECERLQNLPDNYTEGVSDTQRYKMIGNGWTIGVTEHILSFMKF